MNSAALRAQIEAALSHRIPSALSPRPRSAPEMLPTGVAAIDALTGGVPRGCLTEICGPASSGRTSLLHALMAQVTARGEVCALVDASDAFDPASAAAAGVDLTRVLWVRCRQALGSRLLALGEEALSTQQSAFSGDGRRPKADGSSRETENRKPKTDSRETGNGERETASPKSENRKPKTASLTSAETNVNRTAALAREVAGTLEGAVQVRHHGCGSAPSARKGKTLAGVAPAAHDVNAEGNNYHSWMHQMWLEDPSRLSPEDAKAAEKAFGGEALGSRLPALGGEAAGCGLRAKEEAGEEAVSIQHSAFSRHGQRPKADGSFRETGNRKPETDFRETGNRKRETASPAEQALRVADLLLQSGGFALVAVDFGDLPPQTARRVPLTSWFRFRRAVEGTPTAFIVLEEEPHARTCASLVLRLKRDRERWRVTACGAAEERTREAQPHTVLLESLEFRAEVTRSAGPERKPVRSVQFVAGCTRAG